MEVMVAVQRGTLLLALGVRFDESSRTSLTGLSDLLRNAMFIFTLVNPVGSILRRRHRFRVRPRSPLRPNLGC